MYLDSKQSLLKGSAKMTKVIFRKDKKTNEVMGFLPEVEARHGNIVGYARLGQHFEADYLYYKEGTEAVTDEERQSLFKELQSIYDNELVEKKRVYQKDLQESWSR